MDLEKWNVHEWLEKAGLSQYIEGFVDNGYDTPDLCAELQNDDLTAIGVTNKKHRSILFSKARELLNLLKSSEEEATDAPAEEPKPAPAAVSPGVLPAPSPTSPSSYPGGEYSEPWHSFGFVNGGGRIKMKKTSSGEKPPLPPPNRHKKKHPPPSPITTELPSFKREGGETGLTKLQLQLKIREELRAEGVVLSEPPYVDKEGQMCKPPLSELTERYSTKLKLQPLDIYDALCVIWNNENSFVTPLTPQQDQAPHLHPVTLRGGSTETYEEPFDAAGPTTPPDYIKHLPKEGSPKGPKCQTLPISASSSTGNYEEPFDSVSKQQNSSEDSPKLKVESQSKTLPSPKLKPAAEEKEKDKDKDKGTDKKKSSADRESSPKHHGLSKLFRRVGNRRSQSIQEFDIKNRDDKKGAKKGAKISFPVRSKDTLSLGKAQKRQNGASPRHSKHTESSSDADDSPQPTKKHSGMKFRKFVTPPTLNRDEQLEVFGSSSSSNESTPEPVRKLRTIRSKGLTGSDLEISVIRTSDEEDHKAWMVMSKSFDNINDINKEETSEKKKDGGNIFSRFFKFKTMHTPLMKKAKQKFKKKSSNRSSVADDEIPHEGGENSLASSMSMPDIASVSPDKKRKRQFISSSHTPPEQLSDNETKPSNNSSPQHLTVSDTTTTIPVPKPRPFTRIQSPTNDVISNSPVGGSAPVNPSFLSGRGPSPEPSKTPSSGGSRSQSPNSSGSDIAAASIGSSLKSGVKKPIPPPKPCLKPLGVFDERSIEVGRSATLPWSKTASASLGSKGPLKPKKQFTLPSSDSKSPKAVASSNKTEESEVKMSPLKPRRAFLIRANSQPNSPAETPSINSYSVTTETPPTSYKSTPTSDSTASAVAGESQAAVAASSSSTTPPTTRQRPPPKPARSVKKKPQRDMFMNREDGELATSSKVEPSESKNSTLSESGLSETVADRVTPPPSGGVGIANGGPPKPSRRIKAPKVIDSSSSQLEDKEKKSRTFDGEQSNSCGCEPAVSRTLNVSTPSPTSSSPTTNEGVDSFTNAMHDVSASTAELSKPSVHGNRFDSGGSPRTGNKPKLMPKPRVVQGSSSTNAKTVTIGDRSRSGSGTSTPAKPAPPIKPARKSVKIASPDHS